MLCVVLATYFLAAPVLHSGVSLGAKCRQTKPSARRGDVRGSGLALSAGLSGKAVVTTTFLTLAFAQLWHVFDMRGSRSGPVFNEVTRNPWVWAALALCAALLVVPAYWSQMAELLHLAPRTLTMWSIVAGCSLAPMLLIQLVRLAIALSRRGD
jgi:Ca2+-transporting ATPase